MARWPRGLDGRLCYGGDYNPEQWPERVWAEDVALMRQAGVNLVSVGVFSWARLEPVEGRYTFDWLDRVLDLLAEGGIKVALATPTASPPPWFSLAYPDALPLTADGVRLSHGSRDTYCVSAPAYRAAARRIAGELASRYAGHPALALWHVHNEYGTTCHCEHVAGAFRRWLGERYGSLDALNESWTTAFWSQHYSDWAQVRTPRATQYLHNPSQLLDFRRFCSDELLGAFIEQRDLLRSATPDVPITTNYVQGGWVPVDHARWSAEVDLVAVDHYPASAGTGAEEETAFAADLARGWGSRSPGDGWLLMETAPNLIYTNGRMHTKEPGRMARHSLGYVARGSAGAMYFQWRAPRGGAEFFHSALVPHAGPDSRVFREAVELGESLTRLAEVPAGRVGAEVAIGWDAPSWWALQGHGLPAGNLDYLDLVRRAHRALYRAGVTTDVVFPGVITGAEAAGELTDALTPYKLLVLPGFYLVSDAAAEAVRRYVRAGGHLVVTYLSGIADTDGRVRLGGYPGAFRDVLGVRVEEVHPLADDDSVRLVAVSDKVGAGQSATSWTETVHLTGAQAVVSYDSGVLAGRAAITRHRYGAGVAWYVSTALPDDGYQQFLASVTATAGVAPVIDDLPAGLEAVRRVAGEESWLFLLNHTDTAIVAPADGTELVTGKSIVESLAVQAGGYAVIRENHPSL